MSIYIDITIFNSFFCKKIHKNNSSEIKIIYRNYNLKDILGN